MCNQLSNFVARKLPSLLKAIAQIQQSKVLWIEIFLQNMDKILPLT
jgi:hypothetical protein